MFIVDYFLSHGKNPLINNIIHTKKIPTFHLTNLPTELLLIILHELDTSTLSHLLKTCRFLNSIGESIFLKRLGLVDVEGLCVLRTGHRRYKEQIAGLSTSFALTKISRVVCIMDVERRQEWTQLKHLTTNIHHIHHFIARLSYVGSFSIVFTSLGRLNGPGMPYPLAVGQKFLSAFFDLLELVISKSSGFLQIIHSECRFSWPRYQPSRFTKLKKLIQGNFRSSAAWDQEGRDKELVTLPPGYRQPISIQTQLTKLDLQVDILFQPPYSAWTLSVLQNSPIATLTISRSVNRDVFYGPLFPVIFKSIGATLREMKVAIHHQASLATLIANLHLLPSLETLVLGLASCGSPLVPPKAPAYLHLDNLISFTGSVEQAAYLFGRAISCINLAHINLIIDLYYELPDLYPGMVRCFTVLNTTLSRLGVNPKVALCISTEGQRRARNFFPPTDHPNSATTFSKVSSLTLDVPLADPDNVQLGGPQKVLDWLATFHAVTALTLIIRPLKRKKKSNIIRPQNGRNEERDSRLISGITSKHPNIVCNIIDLPPNQYHFHWSNARDEFSRGMGSGLPPIASHRQRLVARCICDDF